ncbi:MAG TPA: hypothetical protein VIN56_07715 [Candidatus Dormibacteraeota bacterium]|jgi:hypothetical protein
MPTVYEFTPAADPIRGAMTLGTFRYEVPLAREEALARIQAATRVFDPLGVGQGHGGVLSWLQGGRLRVWKSTFWRRMPGRGALVFDATLAGEGEATLITGRLHLGLGFVIGIAWVLAIVVLAVVIGFPPVVVAVITVLGLGQYVVVAAAAHRDAAPLLDFVDQALSSRSPPSG